LGAAEGKLTARGEASDDVNQELDIIIRLHQGPTVQKIVMGSAEE
jgi:hypothetical protein